MKVWVKDCLMEYVKSERKRLGLPPTQKVILILDCWAVHRGDPFRDWLKKDHPTIILIFVPGNCTCVAQPCDTRVNRILKHLIKSACVDYLAKITQEQLQNGVAPSNIVINTQPGTLRDASTAWLLHAWNWFQDRPEVVLGAWRDTKFANWDLSYETLTSPRCRTLVYERFTEDPAFCLAISSQIPSDPDFKELHNPEYDDDYALDPSVLCDIRPGALPPDVVEHDGQYDYIGDDDLE
ncbi:DDE superfamily endonuclease [Ceratobasidium sp. AG-Ba]|nr:DDE superfamily endonuclease [Ceratobasidium sp. AG-Ba]